MAHERSLLERIAHPELEDNYSMGVNEEHVVDSVLDHIRKMLNVRHGSVQTLKDYGLPDFNDLASKFPHAIFEIKKAIKACIEKYEPRLSYVKVEHVADEDNPLSLRYDITAQLILDDKKTKIWFETVLDAAGRAHIRG